MIHAKRQFIEFLITILSALVKWLGGGLYKEDHPPAPRAGYFDRAIAERVGLDGAVMLATFARWIAYNQAAHNSNECYWSAAAWVANEFPWLTERQFRYQLSKLEKAGLVGVSGGQGQDRRLRVRILTLQKCQMDVTNLSNGLSKVSNGVTNSSVQVTKLSDDSNVLNQRIKPTKASNESSNSKQRTQIAAAAASIPVSEPQQVNREEGIEPRHEDTDALMLSPEAREFFVTVSKCELEEMPSAAWEWGMYRAKTGKGIHNPVGFARSEAAKWKGQVAPVAKPADARDEVLTSNGHDGALNFWREQEAQRAAEDEAQAAAPSWFKATINQLEHQLDRNSFAAWVRDLRYRDFAAGVVEIGVKSGLARDMLHGRYYRDLRRAFADSNPEVRELRFVVIEAAKVSEPDVKPLYAMLARSA